MTFSQWDNRSAELIIPLRGLNVFVLIKGLGQFGVHGKCPVGTWP